jgi:outer membrane protein
MKRFFTFIFTSFLFLSLHSQSSDTLRLAEALKIGLENNFSIRLVKQDIKLAENNATRGNAGFWPSLDVNASQDVNRQNLSALFITDDQLEEKGVNSTNFLAGAQLNWTLFDGLRMFITYDKLQELRALGVLQSQLTIENTLAELILTYYALIEQQQRIGVWEQSLALSKERAQLARDKFLLGSASKREQLLAEVDVNADRSELLRQQNQLELLKAQMNRLLGREAAIDFEVEKGIGLREKMGFQRLKEKSLRQNPGLTLARQQQRIAELSRQEIQAERYPRLAANLGYTYNRSTAEAGFLLSNQVSGVNAGISLNANLFNGLNLRRRLQNARLQVETSRIQVEDLENQIDSDLLMAYRRYENAWQLLELEEQNVSVSRQNLDIARQTYEVGELSAIEFREAQRNQVATENRLIEARYLVKQSEIELLRLAGAVVGE